MKTIPTITSVCTLFALAGGAQAGVVYDFTEQNDSLNDSYTSADSAGTITMADPDLIGTGHIQPGDVDWYSFSLNHDALLQFATGATTATPFGLSLQMLDSAGNVIVGDAEQGPDDVSPVSIQEALLPHGDYFIGISGYDADVLTGDLLDGMDANGPHNFDFDYVLSLEAVPVSVVPLPAAAWAGLGLMLPLGVARRIKRRR